MADIILNQAFLNAVNSQSGSSVQNNSAAANSALKNINLPEAILGVNLNATVTSNQQLGQVSVTIPQLANFLPQAEINLTTNQANLQLGQQIQVQLPQADAFTKINNTLVANVNVTLTNPDTGNTQNINARVSIVLPNLPSSGLANNQFIEQNISNPNGLVGQNFSAFFINPPDENLYQNLSPQLANKFANNTSAQVPQNAFTANNISNLQIKITDVTLPNVNPQNLSAQNTNLQNGQANISGNILQQPVDNSAVNLAQQAAAQAISGKVIFSGDNETIINSKIGTLRLPVNLQLPVGTDISFEIGNISLKSLSDAKNLQLNNLEALKQFLNSDTTALKDLLSLLQGGNAAQNLNNLSATQAAQAQIPNASDKHIFARAIWFLGNVANGSSEKWLNDDTKKILSKSNNSSEITTKLESMFNALRSFFTPESAPQISNNNWNNFVVPFLDQENNLNYVNFYTEQDKQNQAEKDSKKAIRFLVELNNSYFGEVQIDGLLSKLQADGVQAVGKKLDIIFRYTNIISDADINEIKSIFVNSLEVAGLKGNINFKQTDSSEIPRPYNSANAVEINSISKNGYVI